MTGPAFFDTNILFYAYSNEDPAKSAIANEMIANAFHHGNGVISSQVLGEFFNSTVLRKKVLSVAAAREIIAVFGVFQVVEIDFSSVEAAIQIHHRFQSSYWDSLVIASARRARCETLWTEDLNNGQDYDGVVAKNPFLMDAKA